MWKDKVIHFCLLLTADLLSVGLLVYAIKQNHQPIPIPDVIRQTLPGQYGVSPSLLPVTDESPKDGVTSTSTFPDIRLTLATPLSDNVTITVFPDVPLQSTIANDHKTIVLVLQTPLIPNTAYQVTVNDHKRQASFSWTFTTNATVIELTMLPALTAIHDQMPYKDTFGHFAILYNGSLDTYFVFIHNDSRVDLDKAAVTSWFKKQGLLDIGVLQLIWVPSASL